MICADSIMVRKDNMGYNNCYEVKISQLWQKVRKTVVVLPKVSLGDCWVITMASLVVARVLLGGFSILVGC